MKTEIILLVLTLMDNGQLSGAFVATEGPKNCERRAKVVRSIISDSGTDIRKIACLGGVVNFEKFSHQTLQNAPTYHYLIRNDDTSIEISPVPNQASCQNARQKKQQGDKSQAQLHCVISTQKPKL